MTTRLFHIEPDHRSFLASKKTLLMPFLYDTTPVDVTRVGIPSNIVEPEIVALSSSLVMAITVGDPG